MMSTTFDLLLKSGTVVNQDGEGIRDIGIVNGRIAEIGNLASSAAAASRSPSPAPPPA